MIRWMLVVVLLAAAGGYALPLLKESSMTACGALEKRSVARRAEGPVRGMPALGNLFLSSLQQPSNGRLTEDFVREARPGWPVGLGCAATYWWSFLPDRTEAADPVYAVYTGSTIFPPVDWISLAGKSPLNVVIAGAKVSSNVGSNPHAGNAMLDLINSLMTCLGRDGTPPAGTELIDGHLFAHGCKLGTGQDDQGVVIINPGRQGVVIINVRTEEVFAAIGEPGNIYALCGKDMNVPDAVLARFKAWASPFQPR
jgi:hypothetical protein